jgi:hypothetical protein
MEQTIACMQVLINHLQGCKHPRRSAHTQRCQCAGTYLTKDMPHLAETCGPLGVTGWNETLACPLPTKAVRVAIDRVFPTYTFRDKPIKIQLAAAVSNSSLVISSQNATTSIPYRCALLTQQPAPHSLVCTCCTPPVCNCASACTAVATGLL